MLILLAEIRFPTHKKNKWIILLLKQRSKTYDSVMKWLQEIRATFTNIHWATNFEKAQELLSLLLPDAILVDYGLGYETGIELTGWLRERGNQTPLLLLGIESPIPDPQAIYSVVNAALEVDELSPANLTQVLTQFV